MKHQVITGTAIVLICLGFGLYREAPDAADTVSIQVDLAKEKGPMDPVWAWFGHDEPNYTYMEDGRKLLSELAELSPVPVYVRTHNLLTSGDGLPALKWGSTNAYTEDANGNPVYDWTIIDRIFDTYMERKMKPLVEIGFMPEALSSKPQPYRHNWKPGDPYSDIYTGWRYPPKDYTKWAELVYQWVRHSVDRYGAAEVNTWYWEPWNEPDADYWGGTVEEYCKLYDYTADAVKRALPSAKVGGPHVTGPANERAAAFYRFVLDHCVRGTNAVTGKTGAPIDFIAFHAKGAPRMVDGVVRMDLGRQLRNISSGFEIAASYPELKGLPIIIGESDPEGCAACPISSYPQNGYRNNTMYASYTAAAFARKYDLADRFGVNFEGAVTWAFEFEDQPWFEGFRALATNGVDKPVLNVFRMYGKMQGSRVQVDGNMAYDYVKVRDESVRGPEPDISALASKTGRSAAVMVWNYYDDDILGVPPSPVTVTVKGIPARTARLSHWRIDQEHSNSFTAWLAMGSPQNPTPEQYAALEHAGKLALLNPPESIAIANGEAVVAMTLPRQGVSLLVFEW